MGDIIENVNDQLRSFNSTYARTSYPVAAKRSVFAAFMDEPMRRALAAINNRVVGSTPFGLQAGTSGTPGVALNSAISVIIDGKVYAGTASTNIPIPKSLGTQGTASWCKYLVSVGSDLTYTITKGNESTVGSAGTTSILGDGAYLPDLPEKSCAVGYFVIKTVAVAYTAGYTDPAANSNVVGYYNLFSMPINETY